MKISESMALFYIINTNNRKGGRGLLKWIQEGKRYLGLYLYSKANIREKKTIKLWLNETQAKVKRAASFTRESCEEDRSRNKPKIVLI